MDQLYSHAQLDTLFLELDLRKFKPGVGSKEARLVNLLTRIEVTLDNESATKTVRNLLCRVLEGDVAPRLTENHEDSDPPWQPLLDRLLASLPADDLEFRNGRLLPSTPEPVSLAEEITALESALEEIGSPEARKAYRQAVDNFRAGPGNEEACNGQLRNLLDAVLPLVCERLSGKLIEDANGAIQHLHNTKHIERSLYDLLRGIYSLSNTRGAHLGLSDTEEALFRLHLTTAVVRYLLRLPPPT